MANFNRPSFGRGNPNGFLYNTPVIRSLLYTNVGVFLFQMFFGNLRLSGIRVNDYIAHYLDLFPLGSGNFYPWQLFTYMFLHDTAGIMHIAINMLVLWMFGSQFEILWGKKKFLIYYFLCGLGGAVAHLIISPLLGGGMGPLIGASGAIFGLMIAYGLLFPDNLIYVMFIIPMKAKYAIGVFVVLEFMSVGAADGVGHLAHLGGAVVGLIYLLATNGGLKLFSSYRLGRRSQSENTWSSRSSGGSIFRRKPTDDDDAIDAEYHDIGGTATKTRLSGARIITQEDIDRILDKIAHIPNVIHVLRIR